MAPQIPVPAALGQGYPERPFASPLPSPPPPINLFQDPRGLLRPWSPSLAHAWAQPGQSLLLATAGESGADCKQLHGALAVPPRPGTRPSHAGGSKRRHGWLPRTHYGKKKVDKKQSSRFVYPHVRGGLQRSPAREGPSRSWRVGGRSVSKGPAEGRWGARWEFKSHQNLLSTYYATGTAKGIYHSERNQGPMLWRTGKAEQGKGECGVPPHSPLVRHDGKTRSWTAFQQLDRWGN